MYLLEYTRKELEELQDKLEKLDSFILSDIFKELPVHEQILLCLQSQYMANYEEVLAERVYIYEQKA